MCIDRDESVFIPMIDQRWIARIIYKTLWWHCSAKTIGIVAPENSWYLTCLIGDCINLREIEVKIAKASKLTGEKLACIESKKE